MTDVGPQPCADCHVAQLTFTNQVRDAIDRVGTIRIDDQDPVGAGRSNAALQRGAVAAVELVTHDHEPCTLWHLRRTVGRAVVDDDVFEVDTRAREFFVQGVEQRTQTRAFVVTRDDNRNC